MSLVTGFQIVFAAGVVIAAVALVGAVVRLLNRRVLLMGVLSCGAATVAGWIAFALHTQRGIAVAAGGLAATTLVAASSLALARALSRASRLDAQLERAQAHLAEVVDKELALRSEELERALARARAESVSLLGEQERRIAEERRSLLAEREQVAGAELAEALAATQKQVEQRLQEWSEDLQRVAETMRGRIAQLDQQHRRMTADASARIAADGERLQGELDVQRETIARVRGEIEHALEETSSVARTELESDAVTRRRALHDLNDQMRRRERELAERIEREEAEAVRRVQAGFADVQRRQVETLERSLARAASSLADEATQQFAGLIRTAREDSARRLSRELERAVATFARQAETVLSEQLSQTGGAGVQRLERRLAQVADSLERQREEFVAAIDERFARNEEDARQRLAELSAAAEGERAVLEARLEELARRLESSPSIRASL